MTLWNGSERKHIKHLWLMDPSAEKGSSLYCNAYSMKNGRNEYEMTTKNKITSNFCQLAIFALIATTKENGYQTMMSDETS